MKLCLSRLPNIIGTLRLYKIHAVILVFKTVAMFHSEIESAIRKSQDILSTLAETTAGLVEEATAEVAEVYK